MNVIDTEMSEANEGCRQRIVGPDVPPTDDAGRWERGKSPWHADAFPDVLKARAPEQGDRKEGWFEMDRCGNAVGWVPDGTAIGRKETAEKTSNTGCLAGLRCPACGSLEPFSIACVMWLNMTDEGTDDDMCGEAEWTPASGCRCVACGATGVVSGFRDKKGEGTE